MTSANRIRVSLLDNEKHEGWSVGFYQCYFGILKGEEHLILSDSLGFSSIAIMEGNFSVSQNFWKYVTAYKQLCFEYVLTRQCFALLFDF